MSDDNAPQGQAPDSAQSAASQAPAAQPVEAQATPTIDYESEVTKLRAENAKWRTQLREAQAAAGDNETLKEKLTALEAQRASFEAEREAALKERDAAQRLATAIRLGAKAGVDADVIEMLDLSKLDLTDEKRALEALSKLGRSAGSQARPGNGQPPSDAEMRAAIFGPRKSSIFGG